MEVVTVKHRATVDGQDEARHDAQRCIDALRKRFPNTEFFGRPGKQLGTFLIVANSDDAHGMKLFAEGFMASAQLWER